MLASGVCRRVAFIPLLPGLTTPAAPMLPGATPCPPSGKLTVVPQPFQIRVSFFLYGCWTSRMRRRDASIPILPGLSILAALTPPGATPCPLSDKLAVVPQSFQIRVSFFLYGCLTSGMCMGMNSKTPLPGLTTLAAQMPPGAIPCPLLGKL
jgi:hypothetical protein